MSIASTKRENFRSKRNYLNWSTTIQNWSDRNISNASWYYSIKVKQEQALYNLRWSVCTGTATHAKLFTVHSTFAFEAGFTVLATTRSAILVEAYTARRTTQTFVRSRPCMRVYCYMDNFCNWKPRKSLRLILSQSFCAMFTTVRFAGFVELYFAAETEPLFAFSKSLLTGRQEV